MKSIYRLNARVKSLVNRVFEVLNIPPAPPLKTYYCQYCELSPYVSCYFQNVLLIKLDNHRAICADTKRVIPFDGLVIVEVRLPDGTK